MQPVHDRPTTSNDGPAEVPTEIGVPATTNSTDCLHQQSGNARVLSPVRLICVPKLTTAFLEHLKASSAEAKVPVTSGGNLGDSRV